MPQCANPTNQGQQTLESDLRWRVQKEIAYRPGATRLCPISPIRFLSIRARGKNWLRLVLGLRQHGQGYPADPAYNHS